MTLIIITIALAAWFATIERKAIDDRISTGLFADLDHKELTAWRIVSWTVCALLLIAIDAMMLWDVVAVIPACMAAFAFAHRSYLDGFAVPEVVAAKRLTPVYTLGGSNLNLFPFGQWASRSGVVFIRRNIRELPVYRLTLRSYIAELVRSRGNLAWSIEGGRTRTGKLVNFPGETALVGQFIPVRITRANSYNLYGEVLTS